MAALIRNTTHSSWQHSLKTPFIVHGSSQLKTPFIVHGRFPERTLDKLAFDLKEYVDDGGKIWKKKFQNNAIGATILDISLTRVIVASP